MTKGTAMMKNQARQGDVLLVRAKSVPASAKKRRRESGRVILARGEATGHHHSFGSRLVNMYAVADEFSRMGTAVIEVKGKGAPLQHQEHAPIGVPPGTFRVVRQREYQEGRIVQVAD